VTRRPVLTPAQGAAKARAREEARREALRLMLDWPQGLPPLRFIGLNTGILFGLERDGLAVMIGRDRLDEPRFAATPAGAALLEGAGREP
jgi:hypothetical protein